MSSARVLIVDDNAITRKMVRTTLEIEGYRIVLTARDPAESREPALALAAVAFFQKPADNAELLAAVRDALGT